MTIIGLPVFIYAFLQVFGRNHYALPLYYTRIIAEFPVDGGSYRDTLFLNPETTELLQTQKGRILDTLFHEVDGFAFQNQDKALVRAEDLRGSIYVADFIFTRCGNPDFCPRLSTQMQRIQERFSKENRLKLVSFTVDPEYDTPEILKEYAERYEALPNKWHFLTGDKRAIYDLAYHGYKVNAVEEEMEVTPEFTHAAQMLLVDNKGRVRGIYNGLDSEDVDRLMIEISILLKEQF